MINPLFIAMQTIPEDSTQHSGFIAMIEALSFTIDRISCEVSVTLLYVPRNRKFLLFFRCSCLFVYYLRIQIACKCMGGGEAHATALSIFNILSSYSWDAKLVLSLAAFALNYGEFWLLSQIYSSNQLAKSLAIIKQVPVLLEHAVQLKPRFDAISNLIRSMVDLTRCIIEFKELPSIYINQDVPTLSTATAHIPAAVYWTIRSIVACGTQITSLTSIGHEYIWLPFEEINYKLFKLILIFFVLTYGEWISGTRFPLQMRHGNYPLWLTRSTAFSTIWRSNLLFATNI